jgi:hypothetical protein
MFEEMTRTEAISTYVQMCEEGEEGGYTEVKMLHVYIQLIEQFGYDGVQAELENFY